MHPIWIFPGLNPGRQGMMAVNLSIKDVPEGLAQRLRQRAERNHRSLQGELMSILNQAVQEEPEPDRSGHTSVTTPTPLSPSEGGSRSWVQGWKTIEYLAAERRAVGWKPDPSLANAPLAVDIIRADRDSR